MSIGDILPEILLSCSIDNAAPQIATSDFEMRQIAGMLNACGAEIARRGNWAKMLGEFSATGDTDLPTDFARLTGTVLTGGEYIRVVQDPAVWAMLEEAESEQAYCFLEGGQIKFLPALTGVASVQYVTRHWVSGGAASVTDNSDETLFPERLLISGTVYRWRRQKGLEYSDVLAEFEDELSSALQDDRGSK